MYIRQILYCLSHHGSLYTKEEPTRKFSPQISSKGALRTTLKRVARNMNLNSQRFQPYLGYFFFPSNKRICDKADLERSKGWKSVFCFVAFVSLTKHSRLLRCRQSKTAFRKKVCGQFHFMSLLPGCLIRPVALGSCSLVTVWLDLTICNQKPLEVFRLSMKLTSNQQHPFNFVTTSFCLFFFLFSHQVLPACFLSFIQKTLTKHPLCTMHDI